MKIEEFLDTIDPEDFQEDTQVSSTTSPAVVKAPVMPESALTSQHTIKELEEKHLGITDRTPPPVFSSVSQNNTVGAGVVTGVVAGQNNKPVASVLGVSSSVPQQQTADAGSSQQRAKNTPATNTVDVGAKKQVGKTAAAQGVGVHDAKTELENLIVSLESSIATTNIAESMVIYGHLKQASHRLIELDEAQRKILYGRIAAADTLLTAKLAKIEADAQATIAKINECVARSHAASFAQAMPEYTAAQKLLESIPDVATNFKDEARAVVLQLYADLVKSKLKQDQKKISLAHSQIMEDIVKARQLIEQAKYAQAKELYKKSLENYMHLPKGYLKEKSIMYKTIIALFNEISFTEKMNTLQTLMKQETGSKGADKNLSEAYLLRAKYALKEGNTAQARKDVETVLSKEPAHPKALEIKRQIVGVAPPAVPSPTALLQTKLSRLNYEAAHGNKDAVLKEITDLEKKFPNESRITELKKRLLLSSQEKKRVEVG